MKISKLEVLFQDLPSTNVINFVKMIRYVLLLLDISETIITTATCGQVIALVLLAPTMKDTYFSTKTNATSRSVKQSQMRTNA